MDAKALFILITLIVGAWIVTVNFSVRRSDVEGRDRVMSSPLFAAIDLYIKVSTPILTIAAVLYDHELMFQLYEVHGLRILGVAVSAFGACIYVWGLHALGKQFTPCYAAHKPTELITTGPYRWIRNPIYAGGLLMVFGFVLISGSAIVMLNLILLAVFLTRAMAAEERIMLSTFPEYSDYVETTGRLFPRVQWTKSAI